MYSQILFHIFPSLAQYNFLFSSLLAVKQDHVINYGQRNLRMSDLCDFWAEEVKSPCETVQSLYFS